VDFDTNGLVKKKNARDEVEWKTMKQLLINRKNWFNKKGHGGTVMKRLRKEKKAYTIK